MADEDLAYDGGQVEEGEYHRGCQLVGEAPGEGGYVERDRELRQTLNEGSNRLESGVSEFPEAM